MPKKKEVIKHSAAIQISNEVNLLERRMWNVLLANAYDELSRNEIYEITIKELARYLRFDSNNVNYLKESLKRLRNTEVEWNILNKDNQHEWGIAGLLAEAKIINGVCFYAYSPTLRKNLDNPAVYAKINLILQNKFKSKHTLALYELILDYYKIGETPFIQINNLRKILGLKEDEYKDFKALNRDVIKKASMEIGQKSDLDINIEYQRIKRKVRAVKFRVKRNPLKGEIIDIEEISKTLKTDEIKQIEVPEFEIDNQELFNTLINEFGVSNGKAIEILKTKDEFYIYEVLDVVRNQIEDGKVRKIPAFTVRALEKDYRAKKSKYELDKEQKEKQKIKVKENQELIENLKREFNVRCREKTERAFEGLSENEKDRLVKKFENEIISTSNDFIKRSYKRNGIQSAGVKPFFRGFLAEELLEKEDWDFELFSAKRGYEVKKDDDGEDVIL
jgi:plasmid replication initiation protein